MIMKKTIAIVMLAMLAVLSLCGCGKGPISEAELAIMPSPNAVP